MVTNDCEEKNWQGLRGTEEAMPVVMLGHRVRDIAEQGRRFAIPTHNGWRRNQGCGSGSVLDLDAIGSVDPDSESGSGSRRAKMTHKSRNFFKSSCFEVLDGLF